ncbi:hypothetical protein [Streptomyces sp. NPDC054784]
MTRSVFRGSRRTSLALGAAAAFTVLGATAACAAPLPADSHGAPAASRVAAAEDGCAVVYFDLGETLVHTAEDDSTSYVPGAADYLRELRERNIEVGLITNVPSEWGDTDAARAEALKKEVDGAWTGAEPFAWDDFGDRIFTPRTEEERKPAPVLWERAKEDAGDCVAVYEAETAEETDAATALGYVSYLIGQPSRPAFLPVEEIEELADCG